MNSKSDSFVTPWVNPTMLSWDLYIWETFDTCKYLALRWERCVCRDINHVSVSHQPS